MSNYNLYHYCRRDYTEKAVAILEKSNDIDVFYEDGIFFKFAISKSNVEMCKSLLEYFNNKQFPIHNQDYEEAKEKLTEILEGAIDGLELSQEMKEALAPYINFEDSIDERLNDSFLNEITIPFENETFNSSEEERGLVGNNEPITNHNSEVISH
jgi:hypothetical protein